MAKKLTHCEVICNMRRVHADKYDYSEVVYVNSKTPVKIICQFHGIFLQTTNKHVDQSRGCPKCSRIKAQKNNTKSSEHFINLAKKIHKNIYKYEDVVYVNNSTKVSIICNKHGAFKQTPANHTQGHGCPRCQIDEHRERSKKSVSQVLKEFKKIHGDKYDYSSMKYISGKDKIDIICPIHGKFSQCAKTHKNGCGCPKCNAVTTEEFILRSRKVYGDKYCYLNTVYNGVVNKINITCKTHGDFKTFTGNHLKGTGGCPKCGFRISGPEEEFLNYIKVLKKDRQQKIDGYFVDGMDRNNKIIYEFLGDYWHGNPRIYSLEDVNTRVGVTFGELFMRTINRFDQIANLGYKIFYIWESDWKKWKKQKSMQLPMNKHTIKQ